MSELGFALYAKPSFGEGMARVLDIMGALDDYNYSDSWQEADWRALQSDWETIGIDLLHGIVVYSNRDEPWLKIAKMK